MAGGSRRQKERSPTSLAPGNTISITLSPWGLKAALVSAEQLTERACAEWPKLGNEKELRQSRNQLFLKWMLLTLWEWLDTQKGFRTFSLLTKFKQDKASQGLKFVNSTALSKLLNFRGRQVTLLSKLFKLSIISRIHPSKAVTFPGSTKKYLLSIQNRQIELSTILC